MRKLLLTIAGVASLCMGANAQTRLILYEEFTGENCPPCAQYNPALDALCDANSTKIIKIQYQSPIPSAGADLFAIYGRLPKQKTIL